MMLLFENISGLHRQKWRFRSALWGSHLSVCVCVDMHDTETNEETFDPNAENKIMWSRSAVTSKSSLSSGPLTSILYMNTGHLDDDERCLNGFAVLSHMLTYNLKMLAVSSQTFVTHLLWRHLWLCDSWSAPPQLHREQRHPDSVQELPQRPQVPDSSVSCEHPDLHVWPRSSADWRTLSSLRSLSNNNLQRLPRDLFKQLGILTDLYVSSLSSLIGSMTCSLWWDRN